MLITIKMNGCDASVLPQCAGWFHDFFDSPRRQAHVINYLILLLQLLKSSLKS